MGAGAASGPTNNVGDGNIAGTKPAGDDPPVRKRKSTFTLAEVHVRTGWYNVLRFKSCSVRNEVRYL